jgi:uncharacterized protein (DUF885 family)
MRILFALLFLPLLVSSQEDARFQKIASDYHNDYLRLNPTIATSLGDYRYNDQLENNISQPYRDSAAGLYNKYLDSLKTINKTALSERNQLSYDILHYDLSRLVESLMFPSYLTPVDQFRDYRLSFSQLGSGSGNHPFKTVKDYEDFLHRIDKFVAVNDTAISNMRKGIAAKRVQPRVIMEKVIPQIRAMLTDTIANSIFYTPIKNFPVDFSDKEKQTLAEKYAAAIREKLIPAYRKLLKYIEEEYMPHTRQTVGLHALPNGRAEYGYLVRAWTTTATSADEIFNIGKAEVKRITAEIEKIKNQVGFKGDRKAFFDYLFTDKKFMPFKTEQEVVNAYNDVYKKIQPHISRLFNMVPKTKFEIRPIEKYRAATAAAHYMRGTVDGSRPGIFYFPVLDATKYTYWRMEDLFLHEAIPGHHYQLSLQIENPEIPGFQKTGRYGAYTEGWGLYAENLGPVLGLYTDPYQKLGQLQGEIHRAIRLVVDAGIHSKGWTREQAIKYSLDNEPISEQNAVQEIERYIVMPAQALSYKMGELKILELRRKAEKKLGSRFDIRAFHDEVLKDGAMPLLIFEEKMNRWMEKG